MEKTIIEDWVCGTCECPNFHWRVKCRRCNEPLANPTQAHTPAPGPRVRNLKPGDWFCDTCRAHNFANRISCFKCGAVRKNLFYGATVGYYNPYVHPINYHIFTQRVESINKRGWHTGDWFCIRPDCNAHNYSSRMRCYKCNIMKEFATPPIFASGMQYA